MSLQSFEGKSPRLGRRVFVAPGAIVVGDVELGDDVSLWFNVVVRGDIHWVRVGDRVNLQDGAIVHVEYKNRFLAQSRAAGGGRAGGEAVS